MENIHKYSNKYFDEENEIVHDGEISNSIKTDRRKITEIIGSEISKYQIDKAYVKESENGVQGVYVEGTIWVDIWYRTHTGTKLINHKAGFIDIVNLGSASSPRLANREITARFLNKPEVIEVVLDDAITPAINLVLEYVVGSKLKNQSNDSTQESNINDDERFELENNKIEQKNTSKADEFEVFEFDLEDYDD